MTDAEIEPLGENSISTTYLPGDLVRLLRDFVSDARKDEALDRETLGMDYDPNDYGAGYTAGTIDVCRELEKFIRDRCPNLPE